MLRAARTALVSIVYVVWTSLAAAGTVVVDDSFDDALLGESLELAYDPSGSVTLDGARTGALAFEPSTSRVPNYGYREGAEWARFRIDDARDRARGELVLEYDYALTDNVDFYTRGDDGAVRAFHAGRLVPHREWPEAGRMPAVRLPPGTREVYVRVGGEDSHQLPLHLRTVEAWHAHRSFEASLLAAYYGALFAILVYNALVWMAAGLSLYGYYVGFLAVYGVFSLAYNGWFHATLLGDYVWLNVHLLVPALLGFGLFALRFVRGLLDLGEWRTKFLKASRLIAAGAVLVIVASLFLPYRAAIRSSLFVAPPWVALLATAGIVALRRGERSGRFYLIAWSAFLVGSSAMVLKSLGLAPSNAFTTHSLQAGSMIEFLLLSFALADRIKQLQTEVTQNANIARDASQRALAEQERANAELRRLDKLKDEFLANTSHELRTPLHGMLGLSESVLANAPQLDDVSRDRLRLVVASGRRLSALVNDILDFSKLRHQEISIREKSVDLADAVRLALTVVAPLATPKGLALRSEVGSDTLVRADENRLQQVLTNLLGNAVKFTERGGVTVRAERRAGRVYVSVTDTGIGIADDARARIFESFEQADGSTSRKFGGTGLGLAVTKKLVELHGGRVEVRSAVGEGSTFTFDLKAADALLIDPPALEDDDADARANDFAHEGSVLMRSSPALPAFDADAEPDSIPMPSSRGRAREEPIGHLLVADDDPINVEVLRAQLEPAGYVVTSARDGHEALEAMAKHGAFDGVLLDVMMPRMTGPEAAERIRADHPHGTLPILMLTAKSRPEDAVAGLRAGATDYIGKPFHREELLQRLDSHLQAVRTARAFRRFVPEDFLELLGVERFEDLTAGIGQQHDLTVLFVDVRNFTARSELLGPEGTFRFVNGCIARFEPVVRSHGGFVDKFIGDAVMAIFPGDPMNAVAAAEGLQREVEAYNESRPNAPMSLAIGIGVHKGPVILGTVGDADRLEVTAIGDAVNVAARLESLTKALGAGALVSEQAMTAARGATRRIGAVRVKGRKVPVQIFELLECCATAEEREQKITADAALQRGLRLFAEGDMRGAREWFANAQSLAPLDRVAALYLERATAFDRDGVPADFLGDITGV